MSSRPVGLNPAIFRAYDIRGVVDVDLTQEVVTALGVALAGFVRERASGGGEAGHGEGEEVAIGRDCRLHSERVAGWLADGIVAGGVGVREIGMGPTPALYHAAGDGHGVMVTGSHNPPEYNGFKIVVGGAALHGEDIGALRQGTGAALAVAEAGGGAGPAAGGRRWADEAAQRRYVEAIVAAIGDGDGRAWKVVVDAGNGAAGPAAVATYRGLGHEVVELYCEPDGRFPNHHPDPSLPENVAALRRAVLAEGADVGLAFDGDGDRVGVVAPDGGIVAADRFGALLARRILRERPGATILGEVKCSDVFFDDVRRHGGRAEMGQVGHSLVKDAMRRTGAAFATELSGHLFFADRWLGFDDAVYAGARVLEIVGGMGDELAELPTTHATPELRVECADERKFDVVDGVLAWLRDPSTMAGRGLGDAELVTIDGVRLRVEGGWGLVRASNTQPALVCRVEGESPERRDEILSLLSEGLERQDVDPQALRDAAGAAGA